MVAFDRCADGWQPLTDGVCSSRRRRALRRHCVLCKAAICRHRHACRAARDGRTADVRALTDELQSLEGQGKSLAQRLKERENMNEAKARTQTMDRFFSDAAAGTLPDASRNVLRLRGGVAMGRFGGNSAEAGGNFR